jgi:hypothetical protein
MSTQPKVGDAFAYVGDFVDEPTWAQVVDVIGNPDREGGLEVEVELDVRTRSRRKPTVTALQGDLEPLSKHPLLT